MMQPRFLEKRVEIVERTVEGLSELPGRMDTVDRRLTTVESQIVQLGTEMRGEFSAIREEIRAGDEETRTFMRVLNDETKGEVQRLAEGVEDVRQQIAGVHVRLDGVEAGLSTFKLETAANFSKVNGRLDTIDGRLDTIVGHLKGRRRRKAR